MGQKNRFNSDGDSLYNRDNKDKGFATNAIHNNMTAMNLSVNPVVPGIMTSTSYIHQRPGVINEYEYSRMNNPTRSLLETSLAGLENAKYGLAFSSGTGAITSVMYLLERGDEIIAVDNGHSKSAIFSESFLDKWGIGIKLIDMKSEEALRDALSRNTKMVFLESPTNPLLRVYDLQKITEITKSFNPNIIIVLDNTLMSPFFQKPLDFGVDISVHSVTKYINGHCDVIMGCVMVNDNDLYANLKHIQATVGAVPSPFDCYLVLRGIKTLALRMQRHHDSGLEVARFLDKHPHVHKLYYPELPSHPDYKVFMKQTTGMSGMISFWLKGGIDETEKFVISLKLFKLAMSLGGYESLVQVQGSKSKAQESESNEGRIAYGLPETLIRLSVGLEDVDDLIDDLETAFNTVFQ